MVLTEFFNMLSWILVKMESSYMSFHLMPIICIF